MNASDTERIASVLEGMGYLSTEHEEEAHLLGIVACSVRQKAIDRVYGRIHRWNSWKNTRNLITFVSGCILPKDEEKFLKLFDLLFKIDDLPKLPEMVAQYGVVTPLRGIERKRAGIRKDFEKHFWSVTPKYSSRFQAYIPIQNGCDKFCTFCAVPYTRGREVSRLSTDILTEIETLIHQDYTSITLLGQNVNSYGFDKKGKDMSFAQLLEAIGQLGEASGKELWVYFTSPHPKDMTHDVLETISRYDCLANQIHLPLQSGDDAVLQKMNRSYNMETYRSIVRDIRTTLPTATLFTDIIVGFAGESEAQFENTRKAMREFSYNMAYIACYSPRPGAVSARWNDTISDTEKKRRYQILSQDLLETASQQHGSLIGTPLRVLVEAHDRKAGYMAGKTEGRIPIRIPRTKDTIIGTFVDVEITSARPLSIEGQAVTTNIREQRCA